MRNPFKRKRAQFPNGIPRAHVIGGSFSIGEAKDIPHCATAREVSQYMRTAELVSRYDLPLTEAQRSLMAQLWGWELPDDPFDPSDWLDDIDPLAWDEVAKTSYGDPVYQRPLSNGREHG